jgi:outer membrane protein assembly factor BamA
MMRYFFVIFFCIYLTRLVAQPGGYRLSVISVDSAAGGIKHTTQFKDRLQLENYIRLLPQTLLSKGYLAASVDSFYVDSPRAFIRLYAGQRYQWGAVDYPEEYKAVLTAINGTGGRRGKVRYINPAEDYRSRLLDYFEENGYPFASVAYDSVRLEGNKLSGKIVVERGSFYKIDSIAQLGNLRMNPKFLHRYLGIAAQSPYQAGKLQKIAQRLDELPFAVQSQPWQMAMLGTGGVINTYLENRRSNVLNVLLGVMPASTQTPGNKLLVTGDVNILLRNSFRQGETMALNWQQIQYQSPRLNLLYQQPYLFGARAGVDFFFELFKKDTQFVNLQVRLGMPYEFSLEKAGKVFFHYQQTTVTTVDTNFIFNNRQLPDLASTSATSLGLDYQVNTTNYRLNPRKGKELGINMAGGLKKINPSQEIIELKNPANPGFDYGSLYDSLKLNTYHVRIRAMAAHYIPINGFSVLKLGMQAGLFQSGNYFRNELFQIGGFRLLRGFDEESIFARQYAVATAEYRLISGKNAYFFGFADGGWAQYKDEIQQFSHSYLGTGLGMVLETKNSLINLSWAIGKRNDLPLDLRQSKIHLGLINFF